MLLSTLFGQLIVQYPNAIDRQALLELKASMQQPVSLEKSILSTFSVYSYNIEAIQLALSQWDTSIQCLESNQNTIVLRHKESQLTDITHIIASLNKEKKPITLSCLIYEVTIEKDNDYDLLNLPSETGLVSSWSDGLSVSNTSHLLDTIKLLEQRGQALLISQPTLTVLDQEAQFEVGEKIPYVTTTVTATQSTDALNQIDAGLTIQCTPEIISSQNLWCKLELSMHAI